MSRYEPKLIEQNWQEAWDKAEVFKAFAEGAAPGLVLCVFATPTLALVTIKSMNVCDIV